MNIGFDAKRYFHNARGLGNYSRGVIRLLSTYYPEEKLFLFNPQKTNNSNYSVPSTAKEILPTSLPFNRLPSLWRSFGITKELEKYDLSIYHGLSQELPFGIHKTNVKSVVTFHDAIYLRYPHHYSKSYRTIFDFKNKYSCRVADRIITISEQSKKDVINYYHADPNKVHVIYQSTSDLFRQPITLEARQEFQKKYALPENYLLIVGAIEERKNAKLIIEAMGMFNLDVPLVIVGQETSYMKELQETISKYHLQDKVYFYHRVPNTEIPLFYANASIFVFPSLFEGFGIPIIEALTTGTPVITSSDSCFEETGGNGCIYINPYNAEELGYAIQNVLNDSTLQEQMIEKGKEHVKNFSDRQIANQLMDLYTSMLR